MIEREIPSPSREVLVFLFVRFRDQRTNDQQKRIRFLSQRDGESAQQIVDSLEGIQHTSIHYHWAVVEIEFFAKLFGRGMIKQSRLDPGRHHVDFSQPEPHAQQTNPLVPETPP